MSPEFNTPENTLSDKNSSVKIFVRKFFGGKNILHQAKIS